MTTTGAHCACHHAAQDGKKGSKAALPAVAASRAWPPIVGQHLSKLLGCSLAAAVLGLPRGTRAWSALRHARSRCRLYLRGAFPTLHALCALSSFTPQQPPTILRPAARKALRRPCRSRRSATVGPRGTRATGHSPFFMDSGIQARGVKMSGQARKAKANRERTRKGQTNRIIYRNRKQEIEETREETQQQLLEALKMLA